MSREIRLAQYGAGQLLDGAMSRVEVGNTFIAQQGLRLAHLRGAIGQAGVFAARTPLAANLMQTIRQDGEPEQLVAPGPELPWQAHAAEILGDERVVGRPNAIL